MGKCLICGRQGKTIKHHIDYYKNITLNICSTCHHALHNLQRQVLKPLTNPIKVKCYKCFYSWEYHGINPYYITCPKCLNKLQTNKALKK